MAVMPLYSTNTTSNNLSTTLGVFWQEMITHVVIIQLEALTYVIC